MPSLAAVEGTKEDDELHRGTVDKQETDAITQADENVIMNSSSKRNDHSYSSTIAAKAPGSVVVSDNSDPASHPPALAQENRAQEVQNPAQKLAPAQKSARNGEVTPPQGITTTAVTSAAPDSVVAPSVDRVDHQQPPPAPPQPAVAIPSVVAPSASRGNHQKQWPLPRAQTAPAAILGKSHMLVKPGPSSSGLAANLPPHIDSPNPGGSGLLAKSLPQMGDRVGVRFGEREYSGTVIDPLSVGAGGTSGWSVRVSDGREGGMQDDGSVPLSSQERLVYFDADRQYWRLDARYPLMRVLQRNAPPIPRVDQAAAITSAIVAAAAAAATRRGGVVGAPAPAPQRKKRPRPKVDPTKIYAKLSRRFPDPFTTEELTNCFTDREVPSPLLSLLG
jgi:hypothetical protein